ncbi:hypothetical protein M9Y10_037106 [Tritrichomonas musculus]|uniref:Protein kinase domain-containing protein n=1 Tax=Tritrichomonas musculus TaxID=1915356 RepID=A0ABR2GU20_9EUKA
MITNNNKGNIKTLNEKFRQLLLEYDFIFLSEKVNLNEKPDIYSNIKKSKIIMVNFFHKAKEESRYSCIFSFNKTVIYTEKSNLSFFLSQFIICNQEIHFYFITKSNENYEIPKDKCFYVSESVLNIIEKFNSIIINIYEEIKSSITGYLIQESINKLNNNHIQNIQRIQVNWQTASIQNDFLIEIYLIGIGSTFKTQLHYHIGMEKLIAIKNPNVKDKEIPKLMRREIKNYENLHFPLLPEFYGVGERLISGVPEYLAIEYIEGRTLENIRNIHLKNNEKIRIIFELMVTINFLHQQNFIYRDLKPDNVMIDESNTAILIDFDRMIISDGIKDKNVLSDYSGYFFHIYASPEISRGDPYSFECDIYSLGQMIYYIIMEQRPDEQILKINDPFDGFPKLKDIYNECTKTNPEERPKLSELILEFYDNFKAYQIDDILNLFENYSQSIQIGDHNTITQTVNKSENIKAENKNIKVHSKNIIENIQMTNISNEEDLLIIEFIKIIQNVKFNQTVNKFFEMPFNKFLGEVLSNYDFINVSKVFENIYTLKNIEISEIIMINSFGDHFIIGFEKTIIIVHKSKLSLLHQLFSYKSKLNISFLSQSKKEFDSFINIQYDESEITHVLDEEISKFNSYFFINHIYISFFSLWKAILPCISGYLIKKSYSKLSTNRIQAFYQSDNNSSSVDIKDDDIYIRLHNIGFGSYGTVSLNYYINKEELFAKKMFNYEYEGSKLYEREVFNYSRIKHPLIPKFIGKNDKKKMIAIEFINGHTLRNIIRIHLTNKDKFTIIFEIMLIIEYLHRNHFIYRVLKPNDIIIDENKDAVLIDFDRMIEEYPSKEIKMYTRDLSEYFVSPEVFYGRVSQKSDIYSLGIMIYYIMKEREYRNSEEIDDLGSNSSIEQIFNKCIKKDPKERPSISELIFEFYVNYHSEIDFERIRQLAGESFNIRYGPDVSNVLMNINNIEMSSQTQFELGKIYEACDFMSPNIKKAIHHFNLSSDQNNLNAQYHLGVIYYEGKVIARDIDKAIQYFTMSASQNHPSAQYNLGLIYSEGKYVARDINKAIHYYGLAAHQNHSRAQFNLGIIYYENKNPLAIKYLNSAADQNDLKAQFVLGYIYYKGTFVERDINKSIRYFSLADDQNCEEASNMLKLIHSQYFQQS